MTNDIAKDYLYFLQFFYFLFFTIFLVKPRHSESIDYISEFDIAINRVGVGNREKTDDIAFGSHRVSKKKIRFY